MTFEKMVIMYTCAEVKGELTTPQYVDGKGYAILHTNSNEVTYIDDLSVQTSKYHTEDLIDHISMVAARINRECSNDKVALAIAVLHDLGKKFTIKFNPANEICFYGHEEISAKLAEDILADNKNFTEEDKQVIYAVIRNHLQLKLLKADALKCFEVGFETLYGQRALEYLRLLDKADEGVKQGDEFPEALAEEGYKAFNYILQYI